MARFSRLDVLNRMIHEGLVPVFYHADPEVACRVAGACAAAGVTLFEFTNRGDQAIEVFQSLVQHCRKQLPEVIVGAGSVVEESTAALFAGQGANFIVGPSFNDRVARFCNRRKLAYIPGCATASEIGEAEEAGVEIAKLFPCDAAGGPGFVKALLGPSPWTRTLATGLEVVNRETVTAWFKAGVSALGVGKELISKEAVESADYAAITRRAVEICGWIREARGK